jgi:hypothetical protein
VNRAVLKAEEDVQRFLNRILLHGITYLSSNLKNAIFWDVAPCRSCVNRRFRGTYRLHLQGRKICEPGTSVSRCLQTEDCPNASN